MSALERSEVGHFHIADAWPFDRLTASNVSEWLGPPLDAARDLPTTTLTVDQMADIAHGRFVALATANAANQTELAGIAPDGALVAILCRRSDGQFGPRINLTAAN